jgi:U3 small nucleolar RNA-associated protein 24
MAIAKKTRKFGAVKRLISSRDARLKKNQEANAEKQKKELSKSTQVVREIPQVSSSLFFQYNTALVPPYSILVDVSNSSSARDVRGA